MDAQQELFSTLLVQLKEKFKEKGVGVYDGFMPPEETSYPFVYLADSQFVDSYDNKTMIRGRVYQTIHLWHNNCRERGTVSDLLQQIKDLSRRIQKTKNYCWRIRHIEQRILSDNTTSEPLMHGVLELEYEITGGTRNA